MASSTVIAAGTKVGGAIVSREDLIIEGTVDGPIECGGKVTLAQTAVVRGDITTRQLVIEDGALFEGQVRILRDRQAAKPAPPPTPVAPVAQKIEAPVAQKTEAPVAQKVAVPQKVEPVKVEAKPAPKRAPRKIPELPEIGKRKLIRRTGERRAESRPDSNDRRQS